MKYKVRNSAKKFKAFMIALMVILGFYFCSVEAQSLKSTKYLGFEAAFGTRSFTVNSNIENINGMQAVQEGGSLGIVLGNDLLMTRVRVAGFFYSNGNTPHTQELFETSALVNFYPIELINTHPARLRPYITAGVSMNNIKFFGRYLDVNGSASNNAYEPFLGKLSQWTVQGGLGVEYCFRGEHDFINLFAQATMGRPVEVSSNTTAFSNTSVSGFTAFSVGVSFGLTRRGR